MSIRVIVGSSSEKIIKQLSHFLIEEGIEIVGEISGGQELLRRVHTVYPDLVIIDHRLKGMSGHEVSELLVDKKICPVIAMINVDTMGDFINLSQESIFIPLIRPCSRSMLINTIHLLLKTSENGYDLEKIVEIVKSDEDIKKLILQAKKMLMEHMGLTEDEAHRRLQKQSMDKGVSKIKVAEMIIRVFE